ncbi:MAG: nuclease-related domain-containing protein [Eubacteriales bacterium]
MEYFAKICISFMVIIIAFFCVYLFFKIKKAIETKMLLNQTIRTEELPYKLLKINFSKQRIMRRVYLPYTREPDSRIYCIDLIVINHGGVLLISVKDYKGTIENPFRGDWRQFYNSNIIQFRNPFEESSIYSRALGNLLKKEKMLNIPIRSAVCYINSKTRFKNRIEQLLAADRLISYINDMAKNRFLSRKEIKNTIHIIQNIRKTIKNNKTIIPQYKQNNIRGKK